MTNEALQYLSRADKIIGRLIKKVGPCTLKPKGRRTPFESLVQAVGYQQLHWTAAATILSCRPQTTALVRFPRSLTRRRIGSIRRSCSNSVNAGDPIGPPPRGTFGGRSNCPEPPGGAIILSCPTYLSEPQRPSPSPH